MNEQRAIPQGITEQSSTQKMPLGTIVKATDVSTEVAGGQGEGEFVYVKGIADAVEGSMVYYNPRTGVITLSPDTAGTGAPVAFLMSALTADLYGFAQIGGVAVAKKTAVRISPNAPVYQSATTGRIMGTSASGKQVIGARTASAATAYSAISTVFLLINRPAMDGVN
jgi:hypothetical protein